MKAKLRLDFCDFNGFDKLNNYFTRVLSREYAVEISDRPDLLIYANSGHMHRLYNCKKIFFTSETLRPDFSRCDYAMTCFHIDDPRHLRLPFYAVRGECTGEDLLKSEGEADRIVRENRGFCSFVVTNANPRRAGKRIGFFERLNRYKKVDSGGRALNNIGRTIPEGERAKQDFIRGYKFNICFENKAMEGYTTEKLTDAMWARCIPLYWGNPRVGEEFNARSILSLHDYPGEEEFMEKIIEVDRDEEQYRKLLSEPYFIDNEISAYFDENRLLHFVERILSDPSPPLSRRRRYVLMGRWRLARMMKYRGD